MKKFEYILKKIINIKYNYNYFKKQKKSYFNR